jgi:hypothetical protein
MGIYHRGPYVAVAEQRLNCADIVIGLQEVCGETVAKCVGRDALGELCPPDSLVKRHLDVCFMKMIPPQLLGFLHESQRLLREKLLPYEILAG